MMEDDILDFGELGDLEEAFVPNQAELEELERELGITDTLTPESTLVDNDIPPATKSSETTTASSTTTMNDSTDTTPLAVTMKRSNVIEQPISSEKTAASSTTLTHSVTTHSSTSKDTQKDSTKHASLATNPLCLEKTPTTRKKNHLSPRQKRMIKNRERNQERQRQQEEQRQQEQRQQRQQKLKLKLKEKRQNQSSPLHSKPRDAAPTRFGSNHNTSIKSMGLPLSGNLQSSNSSHERHIHLHHDIVNTSSQTNGSDLQRISLFKRSVKPSTMLGSKRARQEEVEQRLKDFASLHLDQRRRLDTGSTIQQATRFGKPVYDGDNAPKPNNSRGISIRGAASKSSEACLLTQHDPHPHHQPRSFTILGAAKKDTFSFINHANHRPANEKISFINHRPSTPSTPVFQRLGPATHPPVKTKVILSNITSRVTKKSLKSLEPGTIMATSMNRRKNTATLTFAGVDSARDFCQKHNQTVVGGQEIRVNIVK